MRKNIGILLLLLSITELKASVSDFIQGKERCGQVERPLLGLWDNMIKGMESNNPTFKNVTSIEGALAMIPEQIRRNVVFLRPSRSLQSGERYIMKSPYSELVISFNGHEDAPGGNSLEVMRFNGKEGKFEFMEISFENGQRKIEKNPEKCMRCHGSPDKARPIFDPYRFWSQTIPSKRGDAVGGTQDGKEYLDILRQIEKGGTTPPGSRLKYLRPYLVANPPDKVEAVMSTEGGTGVWRAMPGERDRVRAKMEAGSARTDPPSVRLFDEMYSRNFCRINRIFEKDKRVNKLLPFIAAAAKGSCSVDSSPDEFLPDSILKANKEYYIRKGLATKETDPTKVIRNVVKDTEGKQREYFEERVGRKIWNLEKRYLKEMNPEQTREVTSLLNKMRAKATADGTGVSKGELNLMTDAYKNLMASYERRAYQKAKNDIKRISAGGTALADLEDSVDIIGPIRYALEATGFDVSTLSMSFDPLSFTFGDFIARNLPRYEPLKSLAAKPCSELRRLSKSGLNTTNSANLIAAIEQNTRTCEPASRITFDPLKPFIKFNESVRKDLNNKLSLEVATLTDDYGCVDCHNPASRGAPAMPFGKGKQNAKNLQRLLQKRTGEFGDLRQLIWKRISRAENEHGHMPPNDSMTEKDLTKFRNYFDTFRPLPYIQREENSSRVAGDRADIMVQDSTYRQINAAVENQPADVYSIIKSLDQEFGL